ncbi:HEAT repeat-containing protein [Singulisphaera sp. GP187]|uniref:HEAT repeat domain-containing protein n=1 Tax=Singulisphaera sp. GP187 TaxID=1882752 RepID=UPI00092C39DC|nr:HEAT repeat domain-containing protein [Singulisphaera sp. GP187]SIO58522.1 HEAT repeat-containing protein [Singulisphaera sp. GP187]
MTGMRTLSRFGVAPLHVGVVFSVLTWGGVECFADRIVLRGGGEIQGKVVADPSRPDRVQVLLATGKTPLSFEKPKILQVIAAPSVLDEYVVRRDKVGPGPEAQYEFGLWCESQQLSDLAALHYEAAVAQDKSFAPAHQKLGHTLVADRWLNADEFRESQGLVRYKGKWITQEDRDEREAQLVAGAEQASWVRRIRLLRQAIASSPEERARQAEQQLQAIRDPVAVVPLVRVLGRDEVPFRILLDQILGLIPGPEATTALVNRLLAESTHEVREGTLAEIEPRGDANVTPILVRALRSTNPQVVNRAAWALARLGTVAAVPKLVPALITTQYQMVMVPESHGPPSSSAGLGSVGVPIYTNGSSVGFLTPPAVGPGSVAYGATSVSATPDLVSALTVGDGSTHGSRGPSFKMLSYSYRNVEVHEALVEMTGQDFGYDIPSWQRWVTKSFRAEPAPTRRVPQP